MSDSFIIVLTAVVICALMFGLAQIDIHNGKQATAACATRNMRMLDQGRGGYFCVDDVGVVHAVPK